MPSELRSAYLLFSQISVHKPHIRMTTYRNEMLSLHWCAYSRLLHSFHACCLTHSLLTVSDSMLMRYCALHRSQHEDGGISPSPSQRDVLSTLQPFLPFAASPALPSSPIAAALPQAAAAPSQGLSMQPAAFSSSSSEDEQAAVGRFLEQLPPRCSAMGAAVSLLQQVADADGVLPQEVAALTLDMADLLPGELHTSDTFERDASLRAWLHCKQYF